MSCHRGCPPNQFCGACLPECERCQEAEDLIRVLESSVASNRKFQDITEKTMLMQSQALTAIADERDATLVKLASAENIINGMSKTIAEFQDATMLGDHGDLPDTVTPSSLRQYIQDLGDTIDRLHREGRSLERQLQESMDRCGQLERQAKNQSAAIVSTDRLPVVVLPLIEYDRTHEKIVILSQKVGALEGEHIALRKALETAAEEGRVKDVAIEGLIEQVDRWIAAYHNLGGK